MIPVHENGDLLTEKKSVEKRKLVIIVSTWSLMSLTSSSGGAVVLAAVVDCQVRGFESEITRNGGDG